MKIAYCLPIIKNSPEEVIDMINGNLEHYDYFEVWLDYIDGLNDTFVKQLIDLLSSRLVVVFRRQNLEDVRMDQDTRFAMLELLKGSETLVDLDITTQTAELDFVRDHRLSLKVIASYHDYKQTPDLVQLTAIIDTMDWYQPSIYKLASLCNGPEDGLRLLSQLVELKAKGHKAIVSGMGQFGAVTKVFGALWGNEMTFAPKTQDGQSAPGQLTRDQLETIFKELGRV
ncbi:MAG TPA: type I 3-dehydroquinate dehydratase [Candidatus Dormibacteraeota bacterium]|nr:type I 3-dehydroquinate dehydratase [Candidatus Dormibacteraeota bacterium]